MMDNLNFEGNEIIYDWNLVEAFHNFKDLKVSLLDETLRDGLQSSYVVNPRPEKKLELVRLMAGLGIEFVNIGLPGAGERAKQDCITIARGVASENLKIRLACAARTLEDDIKPILDVAEASGLPIEVMSFIGSSPIRMLAEEWDLNLMLERSRNAIEFACRHSLPVTFVTEDTTRSRPDILYRLLQNAVDAGAHRFCVCDTTGHATPDGIRVLLRFIKYQIQGIGKPIGIDWHGHNDRGLALSNSLWAIQWGADRVHGCALGIGERCGNTAMDQLIMNLRLLGTIKPDRDLSLLLDYCRCASRIFGYPIPPNYPLAGSDAFRTQTGVHAAAIRKAKQKGDAYLADRVYSGVPAGMFGRQQEICVGPMSGLSNVMSVLERLGVTASQEQMQKVLLRAKEMNRILSDVEILDILAKG
jgi:2-isopropylmalate synthase